MQIIVLGMHRSGTSALARVLNLAGAYFGVEGVATPANAENRKGFWEREDVRALNDAALHNVRCDWDVIADFDIGAIPRQELATLKSGAAEIVAKLDAHRPWFMKEPRLCLLLPIWRPALEFPVCVHIYRNPLEVARSLKARNDMPIPVGLALWEAYNIAALGAAEGLPQLVVSYHDLMHEPRAVTASTCAALGEHGGYPLRQPGHEELAAFLSARLHRQRAGDSALRTAASKQQLALYAQLQQLRSAGLQTASATPDLSPAARQILRSYEAGRQDVTGRVRDANAARMRRLPTDSATQLILKGHELDRALGELDVAQREARRLRQSNAELERRVAVRGEQVRNLTAQRRELVDEVARQTASRHDVRNDLNDSIQELRAVRAEAAAARDEADQLQREVERGEKDLKAAIERHGRERGQLQREKQQLRREKEHVQHRASALRGLASELQVGVKALLASRRWRLGHAILSLPHRLLLRQPPATAASALLPLASEELPTEALPAKASAVAPTARQGTRRQAIDRERTTIAVLAWDVGHNPFGRAYLIAEALARRYRVVLIGFQFRRYGSDVWAPLRGAAIEPVVVLGRDFPEFQQQLESLAKKIDPDVVIACKARLPTVQLGMMLKAVRNRPVIVDVDDHELSFFDNQEPIDSVADLPAEALCVPHDEAWTRRAERLLPFADQLLVSNAALRSRFGGVLIPHARDESVFDPARVDGSSTRRRLALPEHDRIVLFVGTPRPHKGVLQLAAAVRACRVPNCRLVVVGKPPDAALGDALSNAGGGRLTMLDDQPFDALPALLAAADLVCLLQDAKSPVSRYQLPAKVIDALAMGVPVLATATPPLESLIDAGLVQATTQDDAAAAIQRALTMPSGERERRAAQARRWFVQNGSYAAILESLTDTMDRAIESPKPLSDAARQFLQEQERRYPSPPAATVRRTGLNLVMFWKQNDIGLYGRRFDMIVEHLSKRPDVGHIAIVEPVAPPQPVPADSPSTDQSRLVAHNVLLRRWRLMDSDKVTYHAGDHRAAGRSGKAFADYVATELEAIGIDPRQAVFWHYPYFEHTTAINAKLAPRLKVVDVVDDQRTWADVTAERRAQLDAHYREVLGDADLVFANCAAVRDSMAAMAPALTLVPNGCDMRPAPAAARDMRFRRLAALPRPIVGLVGNLEPKTDSALLHKLATERPGYQLVLIGSTHAADSELMDLQLLPNVTFFGVVTYPEVRAWISHLDVGLVPHRNTEQTQAMHPLKVLAYAAESVPVVSTQVDNLGDFRSFMRVASTHDDFLAGVDEVVDGRFRLDEEALRIVANSNSWDQRVGQIMAAIDERMQ